MDNQEEYTQLSLWDEQEYSLSANQIVKKSNSLINRIGSVSLLSEKILLFSLSNIKEVHEAAVKGTPEERYFKDIKDKTGTNFADGFISSFTNTQLRKALGITSGSYYKQIETLMNGAGFANSWNIIYQDNDIIGRTSLVVGTMFDKMTGKIYIKWNSDVADKIFDLKTNYTELNQSIMYKFKSLYSFSIYQMLRSEIAYQEAVNRKRKFPPQNEYVVEYELSEFKFLTGVISIDTTSKDKTEQEAVRQIENRNYENAERILPESSVMYSRFAELRRHGLDRAYLDINGFENTDNKEEYRQKCKKSHKTDIHFRYELIRSGIGAKVSGIRFFVSWDKPNQEPEEKIDYDTIIDTISDIIDEPLKIKDLRAIAEAAKWENTNKYL